MDPRDPTDHDPTGQNRRQFMRTGAAGAAVAALGLSGQATAMTEDGEFETDPFSLGVASGDPLPTAVVIWTRLAPDPRAADGAMPDETVEVDWTVASDEAMTEVVQSGSTTATPELAHSVHVDVRDLQPNTEYYYQFEAGGVESSVARTKTAPRADATPAEFQFAFASCQRWVDGYYTAYDYMAEEELDLIVHLGDYIYEYGIGANGGVRDASVPTQYREQIESLDQYRLRHGLYKSDGDLQDAHASAPWLFTWDDHEVDNNWSGDIPQDPDEQSMAAFIQRRANAFQAYYEHMPIRMKRKPDGSSMNLYRNFAFGDLVEFNVLDTRQYRDDQACRDGFEVQDCDAVFDEDRTILGDEQESWLLENLETSTATWDVLANQLPFARMDFTKGEAEGRRTEQWDGYVADQAAVKQAMEEDADNPVVITGDFHSNWANEIRSADDPSEPIGAEFVGTSISSSGDGSEFDTWNEQDGEGLGMYVVRENDNVLYNANRRGYVQCTVTPDHWITDFKALDYVSERGSPIRTDARFVMAAGEPGLDVPPTTVAPDPVAVSGGETATTDVVARWLETGLAGGSMTLSVEDPDVATIADVTINDDVGLANVAVHEDGASAEVEFGDLDDALQSMVGGVELTLASVTLEGTDAGQTALTVTPHRLSDDDGTDLESHSLPGTVRVGPPAVDGAAPPTDPDGDGLYEDVNGNGRTDFDDVVTLFENLESDAITENAAVYDFNDNGDVDYDDVVDLYEEI